MLSKERLKEYEAEMKAIYDKYVAELNASELQSVRWRAEAGGLYYTLNSVGKPAQLREAADEADEFYFGAGWYFKTADEALEHKAYLLARQRVLDVVAQFGGSKDYTVMQRGKGFAPTCNSILGRYVFVGEIRMSKEAAQHLIERHQDDLKLLFGGE